MIRRVFCSLALLAAVAVSSVSAKEPDKFIVHEWGTFSTFSGSDGKQLKFYPNDRDLPAFVNSRYRNVKGGATDVMVSLETPVVYFYTDRDRTVSVHVDFPKGLMTDWYPQASRPPESKIRWDNIKVLAKDRPALQAESATGRYFAARETDAASLTVTEQDKKESEKFLFYRGVGDFQLPFVARALGSGTFSVKNTGKEAVPNYFLVRVQDRKVTFKSFGQLSPGAEAKIELPSESSTIEKLGDEMVKSLVTQGLYEKEALAMVKAWSSAWFGENGTRMLYLVAEPVTNEFLPITIDPKPEALVRVLVGRHDILTPEREVEIDGVVKKLTGDSNSQAKAADAELNKLGRYRWPAQVASEKRIKAAGALRTGRE